jgi:heme exporter protein D
MSALGAYFAMGGYAAYVWSAYVAAIVVLGGIALASWRRYRCAVAELERLQAEGGGAG